MKYVVAFSGGVDSTAVILKLLEKGEQVSAIVMDWIPESVPAMKRSKEIIEKACKTADKLGVECRIIDLKKEFEKKIIDYFIKTYLAGRTPNPCALCNRFIKFDLLLERGIKEQETIFATGHYAAITKYREKKCIKRAKEPRIEQSYFLTLVQPEILHKIEFPLAELTRAEVEEYVRKQGFPVEEKSQEICFVDKNFWEIIERRTKIMKEGWIIGPEGEKLRKIKNFYRYTIGQRKGLGVAYGKPLYVSTIDSSTGNVYTTTKDKLGWKELEIFDCNWFAIPVKAKEYMIQIRYRTPPSPGIITNVGEKCKIKLKFPQVIVPGQVAAIYDGDILLGGGIIEKRW